MKVLEFAFDSREPSNYLPHNYDKNCVVYTGTHDNETLAGWYRELKKEDKKKRILMILLSTISTFIGGLLMALISSLISDFVIGILLCLTLGMIIYIVFFELLPHVLHSKNKILSIIGILIGILIIVISSMFE